MRVIKATTDNKLYIVDLDVDDVMSFHKEIGGFECVRTQELHRFFHEPVTMVVDDDGFMKEKPLNVIASKFYNGDIVGDVIFVPEECGEFVEFFDVDAQYNYLVAFIAISGGFCE
ncbi:MAG: DUF3846 domain-containing protein [Agathobacter sp.]|nr:DUF3846 domain-containing protein [Agathobacter sp.]